MLAYSFLLSESTVGIRMTYRTKHFLSDSAEKYCFPGKRDCRTISCAVIIFAISLFMRSGVSGMCVFNPESAVQSADNGHSLEYRIPLFPTENIGPYRKFSFRKKTGSDTAATGIKTSELKIDVFFDTCSPVTVKYSDTYPVRGLHLTSWVAGSTKFLNSLIALVHRTELNAMVVDLKEADGRIAYDSKLSFAREMKTLGAGIADLDRLLSVMAGNQIFPIARICVFKDSLLARLYPELAVKDKNGGIWCDNKGESWADPYNRKVWEYNIALAEEAAARGFREIQFDYVRFPSDGAISDCVYPARENDTAKSPAKTIRKFLAYAKRRLSRYGVSLSADVFGLTCSAEDDMNIGQVMEEIAAEVDYVCPMVYPSHYRRGAYDFSNPESMPYKTVFRSLEDANKKLKGTCSIRPWLQDFSLRIKYTDADVRKQIQAAYDNGVFEWLLWNPRCRYTEAALRSKAERNLEKILIKEGSIKKIQSSVRETDIKAKDATISSGTAVLGSEVVK